MLIFNKKKIIKQCKHALIQLDTEDPQNGNENNTLNVEKQFFILQNGYKVPYFPMNLYIGISS